MNPHSMALNCVARMLDRGVHERRGALGHLSVGRVEETSPESGDCHVLLIDVAASGVRAEAKRRGLRVVGR